MASPSGNDVTPEQWEIFFRELERFGNVTASAAAAGISRITVYRHRNTDPEFRERFEEARRAGFDGLEDEAVRRAAEGFDEPVFYQGQQVDLVRKYSDSLMTLLLKGNHPKYRDRMEMTGPDGGPLQIEDRTTVMKLAAIIADARRRALEGEYIDVTDQEALPAPDDGSDLIG